MSAVLSEHETLRYSIDVIRYVRDLLQRWICRFRRVVLGSNPMEPGQVARPKNPGERVFAGDSFDAVITRWHTGRRSRANWEDSLAQEWAVARHSPLIRLHRGTCYFRELLSGMPAAAGDALLCYRGRIDDGTVNSWEDMGPPPPGANVPCGRYNRAGRPVLYLSSTRKGALRETRRGVSCAVYLQKYTIPVDEIRIADFASDAAPDFVHSVFDLTESACVKGRAGFDDFDLGHLVTDLTADAGYDGMLVCGVLGNLGFQYRNIVVFNPAGRWRNWSRGASGFSKCKPNTSSRN